MKITANLATIKSRHQNLSRCLQRLSPQVDLVRVYCNDYEPSDKQQCQRDNIKYFTGYDFTDNAKFQWVDNDEWYFTCDDDILYPKTYVSDVMQHLRANPQVVFTHHGRIINPQAESYYEGHGMIYYSKENCSIGTVDIPGTGVLAFNSKYFKPNVLQYGEDKMVDVLFALEAARAGVRIQYLPHSKNYFNDLPSATINSIYADQLYNDRTQYEYLQKVATWKESS